MEDKIKKLLTLSQLGATTHERDAAFARATALAASCGIDLDSLEDREEVVPEDFGDLDKAVIDHHRRCPGWKTQLFFACTRITGCFGLKFDGDIIIDAEGRAVRQTVLRAYGRDKALAACSQLYHALVDAIVELSKQFDGRAARNAYRLGAAIGVLVAHEDSVQKLPGTSRALVLARSAEQRREEAKDWYLEEGGRLGSGWRGASRGYGTQSAFAAGVEAGRSLDREAPQRARLRAG